MSFPQPPKRPFSVSSLLDDGDEGSVTQHPTKLPKISDILDPRFGVITQHQNNACCVSTLAPIGYPEEPIGRRLLPPMGSPDRMSVAELVVSIPAAPMFVVKQPHREGMAHASTQTVKGGPGGLPKKTLSIYKLYKQTTRDVENEHKRLMKEYHGEDGLDISITHEEVANTMLEYLGAVRYIAKVSPALAFDLLMYIGQHSYSEITPHPDELGHGDEGEDDPFILMDKLMLKLIEERLVADQHHSHTYSAPHRHVRVNGGERNRSVSVDADEVGGVGGGTGDGDDGNHDSEWDWKKEYQKRQMLNGSQAEIEEARQRDKPDWVGRSLHKLVSTYRHKSPYYRISKNFFRNSMERLEEVDEDARALRQ